MADVAQELRDYVGADTSVDDSTNVMPNDPAAELRASISNIKESKPLSLKDQAAIALLKLNNAEHNIGENVPRGAGSIIQRAVTNPLAHYFAPKMGIDPKLVSNHIMEPTSNNLSSRFGYGLGETAAVAPPAIVGGEAASAGLGALGEFAPSIAPATNFLAGNMEGGGLVNNLIKYASKAPMGAAQGAGANALMGQDPVEGAEFGAVAASAFSAAGDAYRAVFGSGSAKVEPYISKLQEALQRDNIPGSEVGQRLQELGPEATIADLGENTRGVARAITGMPGNGKEQITNLLEERQAARPERILQATTEGLGIDPNASSDKAIQQLIKQREVGATPAYEKAFDSGPINSPRVQEFLKDPDFQKGLQRGMHIQRLEALEKGIPFDPKDYGLTGMGLGGEPILGEGTPNMRLLDAAKKGMDALITDNTDPVTGKVNEFGRALTGAKRAYVNELDKLNPDYAAARASYAGPSQSLEAIQSGKNFIKNGTAGNISELANMNEADKKFFRIGVGQQISDMLDNTADGGNVVKAVFGKPKLQKALQSVFPTPEAFNDFADTINKEAIFAKTERAILQGSRTTPMAQEIENLGQSPSRAAQKAKELGTHAYELGTRNAAGKAIYMGRGIVNRLTTPTPLAEEQLNKLTSGIMAGPEESRNLLLASPSVTPPGRQNLLFNYINRLGLSGGLAPLYTENR